MNEVSAPNLMAQALGWTSSAILLATITHQVRRQWRQRTTEGISRWLFLGQMVASIGFAAYSFLKRDWVFVSTNLLMATSCVTGYFILRRNQRLQRHEGRLA